MSLKHNGPGECGVPGCGCAGTSRPPWSCVSPSPSLTLTWYYYKYNVIDTYGAEFGQFDVGGPLTTILYPDSTTAFRFLSRTEKLPDDSYASGSTLIGNETDAGRCQFIRFGAGCTELATASPGTTMLLNTLNGGGLNPPHGAGDCDLPGLGMLQNPVITASPWSVSYAGARSQFPVFAHGILTP